MIGDLRHRVALQYPVRTADGMGGAAVTWTASATVWAAIWPVGAAETIQADKGTMTITHRIRIRYRAGVTSGWRVSYDGRYFNIVSVIDPNTANRWLDLMCREAV